MARKSDIWSQRCDYVICSAHVRTTRSPLTPRDTVPAEQHAAYAVIIDRILAKSDLNTISAKRIRKELQDEVGEDLTAQKV